MELLLEFSCPTGASPYLLRADVLCFMKNAREGLSLYEGPPKERDGEVILAT